MKKIVAVIPARSGSKGIKNKNLMSFCGKPLLAWSVKQAISSDLIDTVWVSSDSNEILSAAESFGAKTIKRPKSISNDTATSESAWLHAIDEINKLGIKFDAMVRIQATSPIRHASDFDRAIIQFYSDNLDSMLTVTEVEPNFNWHNNRDGIPKPINYDYQQRPRRQDLEKSFAENGSFYIFKPQILKDFNSRLGGKIGIYKTEFYKMFQIDNLEEAQFCEVIMRGYGMDKFDN